VTRKIPSDDNVGINLLNVELKETISSHIVYSSYDTLSIKL